jgi:LmbE family N-acetylglucosaminyl deacetylase
MAENGLLAIYAHPDDETFGVGATMARYAANGVPVTMVCATRGEVGEIAPGTGATPENLMLYRAQELVDAMAILGVHDVRFLGFRDSGMQGTEENEDQRAFMRAHPDGVVHMLVRLIRELKPAVVVTWDKTGGYGHPDHVATHFHATAAFHAAADAEQFPTAGPPWQAKALFYTTIPVEEFMRLGEQLRERGIDFGAPGGEDEWMLSQDRLPANCVIDVADLYEKKMEALLSHKTQISADDPLARAPEDISRQFFSREFFHRAHPPLEEGTVLDDMFAGL